MKNALVNIVTKIAETKIGLDFTNMHQPINLLAKIFIICTQGIIALISNKKQYGYD